MSDYGALIRWQKGDDEVFSDNQYSRGHTWEFDGGVVVPCLVIASCCAIATFG